jgi:hypothetical protein
MPEGRDAKFFQVVRCQMQQDRLVYLILAECCLILPEAKAPQPDHNVHDGAPQSGSGAHHLLVHRRCPGQIGLWVSQRFTETAAVISQWQCLSVIVKIPERPRNPDFPASEGPIFICLRACGSFQRNTLRVVIGLAMFTREA